MDLSKALDTTNYSLLMAKLEAYSRSLLLAKLLCKFHQSDLSNRFQRTNVDDSFSKWTETSAGVPQGSISGPLLLTL